MTHPNRVRLSKLSLGLMVALAAAPVFAQSTSAGANQTLSASSELAKMAADLKRIVDSAIAR